MTFDASPRTMRGLAAMMRRDPRVVRWTTLKLGERLQDVVDPGARTLWHNKKD
jgi:small subunit ribosomal protein S6